MLRLKWRAHAPLHTETVLLVKDMTSPLSNQASATPQLDLWGSYRLGEAFVLGAALHVERLDLGRETTEQDGLVDGVGHQPLWSLGDVLTEGEISTQQASQRKRENQRKTSWIFKIKNSCKWLQNIWKDQSLTAELFNKLYNSALYRRLWKPQLSATDRIFEDHFPVCLSQV